MALTNAGLDWSRLCASASEIVLFGSRATGCATHDSDWDLLVIGSGAERRRVVGTVDLVPCPAPTGTWLGTDIATHVSSFGRWLHGTPEWRSLVQYEVAARAKENVLRRSIKSLASYWDRLAPRRRLRHLRAVRLDAQRLVRLRRGLPVPATAWLDEAWQVAVDDERAVHDVLSALGMPQGLIAVAAPDVHVERYTPASRPAADILVNDSPVVASESLARASHPSARRAPR